MIYYIVRTNKDNFIYGVHYAELQSFIKL